MSDDAPRFRDAERHDGPGSGLDAAGAPDPTPEAPRSGSGRDVWRASASFGFLIGVGLLLTCAVGIALLLARIPSASGGQRVAWVAIAAALTAIVAGVAVLLRALPTMRYRFVGDALVVEWLGQRRVIPVAEISNVIFEPTEPLRLPRWEPFWPGYYVATVRTPEGVWNSWATQRPQRRVRIVTARGIVAISPERPVRFVSELERRRDAEGRPSTAAGPHDERVPSPIESGSNSTTVPSSLPSRVARQPRTHRERTTPGPLVASLIAYRDQFRDRFLADPVASALVAAGVVLPVLMVAYLYSQFEGLPGQIPIHWDANGDVVEQTTPSGLWRFPRIAVVILVVNTAIATLLIGIDRYLARLLVAAIPLVQVILFIALIRAVN